MIRVLKRQDILVLITALRPWTGAAIVMISLAWPFARAQAYRIYTEAQLGASKATGGESFLGGAPKSIGFGGAYGGFFKLTSGDRVLEPQIGLFGRFDAISSEAGSAMIAAPYLALRIQISRLYIGGGYAPYLWRQTAAAPMGPAESGRAIMGEAGLLWPVIPQFSLGIAGSVQTLTGDGAQGPKILTGAVLFRFYMWKGSGGSSSSNEYKGWRYPLGIMK